VEVIDERNILKEELKDERQRAERAEAELEKLRRDNDETIAVFKQDAAEDHGAILGFQRRAENAEAELSQLRTQLAAVEKERDEANAKWKVVYDFSNRDGKSEFVTPEIHGVIEGIKSRCCRSLLHEACEHTRKIVAIEEANAALAKECEGLRELLGEALSVLRGDWSVLSLMHCAEKIRNKLSATRGA